MNVLALHAGDLYLRAAYLGPRDAPHVVEDAVDTSRFQTPSVVALDAGGALLGFPALMTDAVPSPERVLWRYRREALASGDVVAHDLGQRALTSDAFVAFALRRLAWEATAYAASAPALALTVPGDLAADTVARVTRLAEACTGQTVSVVPEDDALLAALPDLAPGPWLVASFDDDALRLRVAGGDAAARIAPEVHAACGLAALRQRWLERWNADAAALVAGAAAFGAGEGFEFERLWQEVWEALTHGAEGSAPATQPLVRQSTLLPLVPHLPALRGDVAALAGAGADAIDAFARGPAAAAPIAGALIVAEPAVGHAVAALLPGRLALPAASCRVASPDRYARGAALCAAAGRVAANRDLDVAPYQLCVLGLGDDGRPASRPLLQPGSALPAATTFTVVANPEVQRHVTLTLVRGGDEAAGRGHRFEFGPLTGQGVQRVNVSVEWRRDGGIEVTAADRESGAAIPCLDRSELVGGVALAGPRHLQLL